MAPADAGAAGAGGVGGGHSFLDDDVAIGAPAEEGLVAVQRETPAGFAAADKNEVGHGILSGTKAQRKNGSGGGAAVMGGRPRGRSGVG